MRPIQSFMPGIAGSNSSRLPGGPHRLDGVRYTILRMYDCPVFHLVGHEQQEEATGGECAVLRLVGHRRQEEDTCGPVVRATVVWHHVVMDAYSNNIIRRDVAALAREEALQPANLRVYAGLAVDLLAKPVI